MSCLKGAGQCNGLGFCILLLWNLKFVPYRRNNKCPEIHKDIIDNNLWPLIARLFGNNEYIFMDDNGIMPQFTGQIL